jgi:hypothetical protein
VTESRRDEEPQPARSAEPADGASSRRDLRHTVHEDFGVRVERDLTGSSMFLARGSNTHFHKIKFSAQGRPAAELPNPEPVAAEQPAVPSRLARAESIAAVSPEIPPVSPPESSPGLLDRLRRLLGL